MGTDRKYEGTTFGHDVRHSFVWQAREAFVKDGHGDGQPCRTVVRADFVAGLAHGLQTQSHVELIHSRLSDCVDGRSDLASHASVWSAARMKQGWNKLLAILCG